MKRIGMFFVVLVFCWAAAALAAGDAARGGELARGCACHKSKGDLDGKDAAVLLEKMQAYKDGKGGNKAMIAIMKKQSDGAMADLAAYYASLPGK